MIICGTGDTRQKKYFSTVVVMTPRCKVKYTVIEPQVMLAMEHVYGGNPQDMSPYQCDILALQSRPCD